MSVTYWRYKGEGEEKQKTQDWAEYEGCAQLEMGDLLTIINGGPNAFELLQSVVTKVHIIRPKTGETISDLEPESVLKIRPQVLDWLRNTVREAARDEVLDPLA
jgi:hypothetical protein